MHKISIITVVKNGMPYLDDCLKSFQLQNYPNKEQIVLSSSINTAVTKKRNG